MPVVIGGTESTDYGSESFDGAGFLRTTSNMTLPGRSDFQAILLSNDSVLAIGGEQSCGLFASVAACCTSNVQGTPGAPGKALTRASVSTSWAV